MLGVCIVCQCYHVGDLAICRDCEALLERMVGMYENSAIEFSCLWQRFHSLGIYRSPLDALLRRGKYQEDLTTLKTLGRLLAKSLSTVKYEQRAAILPIPMSHGRFVARGYNQAAVIAREVARQLAMPYIDNIVRHTGNAGIQHELSRQARKRNMRQAFEIMKPPPKRLCIVDDIYTTGATMQAICRILRQAGCEYIEIWLIAKTL